MLYIQNLPQQEAKTEADCRKRKRNPNGWYHHELMMNLAWSKVRLIALPIEHDLITLTEFYSTVIIQLPLATSLFSVFLCNELQHTGVMGQ